MFKKNKNTNLIVYTRLQLWKITNKIFQGGEEGGDDWLDIMQIAHVVKY